MYMKSCMYNMYMHLMEEVQSSREVPLLDSVLVERSFQLLMHQLRHGVERSLFAFASRAPKLCPQVSH